MSGNLTYAVNEAVSVEEFIEVLRASTLGERRPVDDRACLEEMLKHANLVVTARDEGRLIGIARSLTDFAYVAYMSDLAVDQAYQHQGVGRKLIRLTRDQMGPQSKIVLLAAPAAEGYYPRLGFTQRPQAWILSKEDPLK